MKKFQIGLTPQARADLDQAYQYAAARAPETATRWLIRFEAAILSLQTDPQRCGFAAENGKVKFELRQLLFGRKPNVFRVLFTLRLPEVIVLRIRHASQQRLRPGELEKPR